MLRSAGTASMWRSADVDTWLAAYETSNDEALGAVTTTRVPWTHGLRSSQDCERRPIVRRGTRRVEVRVDHPFERGARGRVTDGPRRGMTGVVVDVDGDSLQVELSLFGRPVRVAVDAAAFEPDGSDLPPRVSPDSRYQLGDVVFVHAHLDDAVACRAYTVGDVDERSGQVFLWTDPDPDVARPTAVWAIRARCVAVPFGDVTPVRPLRVPPLSAYLDLCRRRARAHGPDQPLIAWCAEALAARSWDPAHPELDPASPTGQDYRALEERIWTASAASLADQQRDLTARMADASPEAQVDRWPAIARAWRAADLGPRAELLRAMRALDLAPDQQDAVWALRGRLGLRDWSFRGPTAPETPEVADDRAYAAWRVTRGHPGSDAIRTRTDDALRSAVARLPAVAAFAGRFGLPVPRGLAVARAWFDAVGQLRSTETGSPWMTCGLGTCNLLAAFDPGRLDAADASADPRLDDRHPGDPPELVTVMRGGIDGLHWGLWVDDPRFAPCLVVHTHRSYDPIAVDGPSLLGVIGRELRADAAEATGEARFELRLLLEHAYALDAADRQAVAEDTARACPHPRTEAVRGPGVAAPGPHDPLPAEVVQDRIDPERVPALLAAARAALDHARPAPALAIGRALDHLDLPTHRRDVEALLVDVYLALDRPALAEIVRADHDARRAFAHRGPS
ncbi:MAG: hypothetical protein ABMB14_30800 [Myxococcota bacterium]